jgi:hypothetical protein
MSGSVSHIHESYCGGMRFRRVRLVQSWVVARRSFGCVQTENWLLSCAMQCLENESVESDSDVAVRSYNRIRGTYAII